jgi:dephospho-CoA kinase
VAAGLVRRGALLVDADQLARRVVEPGGPAYGPLMARFGAEILQADGTLDRAKLASIVFADPDALADLNAITHPAIAAAVDVRLDALAAGPGAVLVLDHPLLTPKRVEDHRLDAVVVVDTPTETAVARLMQHRGFQESDARARVAAQISRDERLRFADLVIDNTGDVDDLDRQLDLVWADLCGRAGAGT